MACKMLIFDLRETEKNYFNQNNFEYFEIKFFQESLNEETVKKIPKEDLENALIISVFTTSEITEKVIEKFKNLRIVSTRSTGCEHIDFKPCINKNIAIINVEKYGNNSVAQFTFTLILALVRQLFPAILAVKNSTCLQNNFTGRNLANLTLGIIGTGAIGASVCKIANAFDMDILAYDISPKEELKEKYNVKYVTLNELLKNADIVSLHLPYNKNTYHIISDNEFKKMKDNSYFINVSRGELVNLNALLKYVKRGKFQGVGLDVVACVNSDCLEDVKKIERTTLQCLEESNVVRELNSYSNVLITPHMSFETQESVEYILEKTFDGLKDFVYGGHKYRII